MNILLYLLAVAGFIGLLYHWFKEDVPAAPEPEPDEALDIPAFLRANAERSQPAPMSEAVPEPVAPVLPVAPPKRPKAKHKTAKKRPKR